MLTMPEESIGIKGKRNMLKLMHVVCTISAYWVVGPVFWTRMYALPLQRKQTMTESNLNPL